MSSKIGCLVVGFFFWVLLHFSQKNYWQYATTKLKKKIQT